MKTKFLSFLFIAAMFAGCTKDAIQEEEMALKFKSSDIEFCGEPEVFTLWGGKTIDVGTVTVANDEKNLYVTYATTGDWWLHEVHLYVLDYEPTERLTPGQAPYKEEFDPYVKTYTITVPLADDITCDETVLWLQAHAAVVKIVDGEIVQGETAYGGTITEPDQGSWYGNIMYLVQCCEDEEEPCYEFEGETAWATGTRYVTRGNWATYTPYAEGTVKIYAGQTIEVGTATFSAIEAGMVTITIELIDGWVLEDVEEAVKIQGYDVNPPAENPSPGLFATYKGNDLTVTVPAFNFYGIHLNSGQWIEVPCPEVE
jgi:hypothetical protein